MFELVICGFHYQETANFVINRPEGTQEYLFLFFRTPVYMLVAGQIQKVEANSFVLFKPTHPQYYHHPEDGFLNDWFHFHCTNSDWLENFCHIDFNTPITLNRWEFIPAFISGLEREHLERDRYSTENIQAMLTQFFIQIGRVVLHQKDLRLNPYMANQRDLFVKFRTEMLLSLNQPWTITQMSEKLQLSDSRFSILYKNFFQISPKEDLMRERIIMAKHFLTSTQLSVGEIASKVGFESVFHFSKQFKKATGIAPSRHRMDQ